MTRPDLDAMALISYARELQRDIRVDVMALIAYARETVRKWAVSCERPECGDCLTRLLNLLDGMGHVEG